MKTELSNNELRRLDLTLLLVFLGLMKERKAATVATDLGLTQSAISQSLKRLRDIFNDDLFLRRPHGLEPTAFAIELEAPITLAIETLRTALGVQDNFNPATAKGLIKIAALDAEQAVFIPSLANRLEQHAKNLRISVLQLGRQSAIDALEDGRVDVALGFIWNLPSTISTKVLYSESYKVVGKSPTVLTMPDITLKAYCDARHILVSPAGDLRGIVDESLEKLGKTRNVWLGLPAFLPAFAAAEKCEALLTVPARLAQTFAKPFNLEIASPPLELREFKVSAYWHKRNQSSAKVQWLISQMGRV